jgi:CheY-specific phosphatase CheX
MNTVIRSDIAVGDISLIEERNAHDNVSVVIRLEGESGGDIILCMPVGTALKISSVLFGDDFMTLSHEALDSLAELANMIAGNAAGSLNDLGFDFTVLPPRIVRGGDLQECSISSVEAFQVPLYTEYGEMTVNVALKTN